jgi:hypothetical protein
VIGPALGADRDVVAREEEIAKLWRNVLELLRDGTAALNVDIRAGRLS